MCDRAVLRWLLLCLPCTDHVCLLCADLSDRVQVAAEIAAPLAKVEEIVLLGGQDKITSEITRLVGQVPPAISALTGVDLSKVST